MKLELKIKKRLGETVKKHRNKTIRVALVEERLSNIIEPLRKYRDISDIPMNVKTNVSKKFLWEIHQIQSDGLLNEGLWEMIKGLYGDVGAGALEGILVEPFVNSVLSKLGLGGFFKNVLVSFFSTNPERVAEAFKSCEDMTRLISLCIAEGTAMMLQKSTGLNGVGYNAIRNVLGKQIEDTNFVEGIETEISSVICENFDSFMDNTQKLLDKIKGQSAEGSLI